MSFLRNRIVVYFDQLVETFFSAVFQPLLFISNLFQWFHGWNQQKRTFLGVKKWNKKVSIFTRKSYKLTKKDRISRKLTKNVKKVKKSTEKRQLRGTPSGSRPVFACRPALRSRQKHIFFFFFRRFLLISAVKSLKKVWNKQKRMKKCFDQLLGARSTQNVVEIHNTMPLVNLLNLIMCRNTYISLSSKL